MNRLATSILGASLLLSSCGEKKQPPPVSQAPVQPAPQPQSPPETAQTPPAVVPTPVVAATPARPSYTVRAEVAVLPGIESSTIRLHHERIPNFANREGKVGTDSQGKSGMKPMTMSFAKGADVSYEGLKIGDRVEVIVEMNWEAALPDERIVIVKLTKLPGETKLDFEGKPSITDPKPAPAKREPK